MPDNSTGKTKARKAHGRPKKPYPEFPLYAHPLGYWSKKIRGKIVNFGRWGRVANGKLTHVPYERGWQDALTLYQEQVNDLKAGRTPRVTMGSDGKLVRAEIGFTVNDLCNRFLTAKNRKLTAGEIGPRMLVEYKQTTDRIVARFGGDRLVDDLAASDFAQLREDLAERFGPVRLCNEITKAKSVFKFATDNDLLTRPLRYGSEFKKPTNAVLRKHKAKNGPNMLEANEVFRLIESAANPLPAMLLLMVNCGFGAMDCAQLPLSAIDLERGWIIFPRPKSGIARRCPLWPETVAALRMAIAARPKPKQESATNLVFVTTRGRPWLGSNSTANPVTVAILAAMRQAQVHRAGHGAYTLRHVFRTVADGALDRVAIDLIMGHSDPSMGGHYRERVDDARLVAVTDHVRKWLFDAAPRNTTKRRQETCDPSASPGPAAKNGGKGGGAVLDLAALATDLSEPGNAENPLNREAETRGSQENEPAQFEGERPTLRLYTPEGGAA